MEHVCFSNAVYFNCGCYQKEDIINDIRSYLKSDNFNQLSIDDKLMFIRLIDCIPINTENKKSNCKGYVQYSTIIDDMGLPQNYHQPEYYHHPAIDNVK